jgi:hypothetical protein
MASGKGQKGRPAPAKRPRWPYFGQPQKRLLFAGFGIWIGTALPWFFFRPLGITRFASPLAASWLLWAGLMAMAGAVARWRVVALVSALAGGGTALFFGFWQMLVILQRCGFDLQLRCFPGPGVFLIQIAGAVALFQAWRLFQSARAG